jgi:translation initiation factor IF-2
MEKYRVYELAKELNTTSKRLMEKLAEINIVVKNHMSLLDEKELDALYNHIGVIRRDDTKKADVEERKTPPAVQPKAETARDVKNAPRIIRKTEIIIDSNNDGKDENSDLRNAKKGFGKYQDRSEQKKHGIIRTADSNSGLRPGFIRDTRPVYQKGVKPMTKSEDKKEPAKTAAKELDKVSAKDLVKEPVKEPAKDAAKETVKEVANAPVNAPDKKTVKEAEKEQPKMEIKQEGKAEVQTVPETQTAEDAKAVVKEEQKSAVNITQEQKIIKKDEKIEQNMVSTNIKEMETTKTITDNSSKTDGNIAEGPRNSDVPAVETQQGEASKGKPDQKAKDSYKNQNDHRKNDGPKGQAEQKQGAHKQGEHSKGQGNKPHNNFRGQNDQQKDANKSQADQQQRDSQKGQQSKQYNNRQQGGNRGQNDLQANNFDKQGSRPAANRNTGAQRSASRPLEIPKPDMTLVQNEEINSQRNESRREYQNKDADKGAKREQKRELLKNQINAGRAKKVKPLKVGLGDKKDLSEILSDDFVLDELYADDAKKAKKPSKKKENKAAAEDTQKHVPPKAVLTSITIPESLTVKELAEALKKTSTDVIKKLMSMGVMATVNQTIDFDTAAIIADEYGVKAEKQVVISDEDILFDDSEDDPKDLVPRPPVVVVMGHVDHGKTSLLDAIRQEHVAENEAGGITQHIGAYMVTINNRNITFLDTPGHEAFTAMRARGAQVTDIAILVVAADDGIMPQTVEAINHAKAANVAIIVAINKIDKPGANPEKVKQELTEYGLVPEEWGGDVIVVPVSAKQKTNIDLLLEMVLLTADMLELKANPNRQAKGTVIEAKLDKNRGPIATVLVQRGTLKLGDSVVTGTTVGRIRAMVDETGRRIKAAGPSTPVEILGLPEVPEAGEIFYAIEDEKVAKHLAERRKQELREQQLKSTAKVSLDDLFNQIKEGKVKDLNIIVKADVQGSVEAVKQSLEKLSNDEVRVKIIHGAVGAITESDVTLAQVSNAIIIGFNVRPGANVMEAAENANVDIRLYRVIYNAIEDIQAAMKGMLEPTYKEVVQGHAEVRQTFKVSGVGTIAGCYVTDGKVVRNSEVRLVRDGIVVYEGKLASLKRFKDDVREVAQGYECGMSLEKFNDIKEGDVIESYIMEEIKR